MRSGVLGMILVAALMATGNGCATNAPDPRPGATDPYPDWVRIVPAKTDDLAFYVGGSSIAADSDAGVELALADALSQAELDARGRFYDLFDRVAGGARAQLSVAQLERVRSEGASSYFARIERALERRDVHQRPCGRQDAAGNADGPGPVCETFVLLTLKGEQRDALLVETLAELRRMERDAGRSDLADLVERMLRTLE